MASQSTQISASVSKETKKLLDAYTHKRGIKKSFVIEQALRHHLLAAAEIPEEFIVPPMLRIKMEGLRAIVAQLESTGPPTPARLAKRLPGYPLPVLHLAPRDRPAFTRARCGARIVALCI